MAVAQALEGEWAEAAQLAGTLGRGVSTIHRLHAKYCETGSEGIMPQKPGPKGPRLTARREALIRRWYGEGVAKREIARRISISEGGVRGAIRRLGLETPEVVAEALPGLPPVETAYCADQPVSTPVEVPVDAPEAIGTADNETSPVVAAASRPRLNSPWTPIPPIARWIVVWPRMDRFRTRSRCSEPV